MSEKLYKFLPLPPDFSPVDCTVDEAASFRRESRWTVFRKIREGKYIAYKDGRVRKIVFSSVLSDRQASIARSSPASGKRRPGRPKHPERSVEAAE
jgi:hypothetical protein